MTGLTPKQMKFVEEFLVDCNATQAAIRAGYSQRSARQVGAANMSKHDISAEIKRRMAGAAKRAEATAERVLTELVRLAFSDIRDVVSWKTEVREDGTTVCSVRLTDSADVSDEAAAAIAEVRQTRDGLVVKMRDKTPALERLAKRLGLDQPEKEDQPRRLEIHWLPPRKEREESPEEGQIAA